MSVDDLLESLDLHPILVDLGASGDPPEVWADIARRSVYIGFDPDQRDLDSGEDGVFSERHIVPRAVTAADADTVTFYLTKFPYCSSTLQPDDDFLYGYLMAPWFEVESTSVAPATTLGDAIASLGIDRIDWFKADTQGTDLRIFMSLSETMREGVLAVDVEPGLVSVYRGEDCFAETHDSLSAQGFWLSRMVVKGSVRMTEDSRRELGCIESISETEASDPRIRESPVWCEARYLRTVSGLDGRPEEDWVLAWVFAMLDDQPGFALDLAREAMLRFPRSESVAMMRRETVSAVRSRHAVSATQRIWRGVVPEWARRAMFSLRTRLAPRG